MKSHKQMDSQSPGSQQLPPVPYPMGVLPEFTRHSTPIALRLRESRSWSGDDFSIKDAITGNPLFQVDSKAFSLSRRRTLLDHTGRPLFEFCSTGTFQKNYAGYKCGKERETLFVVERKSLWRMKLEATFANLAADGQQEKWLLKGQWFGGSAQITNEAGVVVASIARDFYNSAQLRKYYFSCVTGPNTFL